MELIEKILNEDNLKSALKKVKSNKGAAGVDGITTDEIEYHFSQYKDDFIRDIREMKYKPDLVKRVYIPKANGKKRPLGIPTVADRVIQQAIAQVISGIVDPTFSEHSHGFRKGHSCHTAISQALTYLNEGYEWIVDLDIEKYFDTVNHDKLISILRENVNDKKTLHLIRAYLKAGVLEDGLKKPNDEGVPQGGPLSPLLSNIYLDKFDKELESRGLNFVRYADDCCIFVKSKRGADRVMKSVTTWLEKNLKLKVNATKTKVVRPMNSKFLGFSFYKNSKEWKCRPLKDRKQRLYDKIKVVLKRNRAVARPLSETFKEVNEIVRGWINYYRIGSMKTFLIKFGEWLRHKVRVVILKQWKKPKTIYKNLQILNRIEGCNFTKEDIFKVANSRLGWYRKSSGDVVNFTLSPKRLETPNKKTKRQGLINPVEYYLR